MRKYCASSGSRPTTPSAWQSYASSLKLEWEISNILFQEVADAGRANSSRMYLYDRRMSVDWDADPAKPGFWTYDGKTTNPQKWPWDPRLDGLDYTTWVRAIGAQGSTKQDFVFTTPEGQPLGVFKTDGPGTTTPPCAVFSNSDAKTKSALPGQPAAGSWLWQDTNGDEQPSSDEFLTFNGLSFCGYTMLSVDEDGGIWWRVTDKKGQKSLEYFKVQGISSHGCPIYSNVSTRSWNLPLPQF